MSSDRPTGTTSPGGQSGQTPIGQAPTGQAPTGQAPTGQTSPIPGQAQPIGPSPPQEQTPLVPPTSPPQANQPTAVPGQAQPIRPATPPPPPPTAQVDRNRECGICRQRVLVHHRMFGLLENCHHCFDISCLLTWMTDRDTCPVCRIPTGRVLMWTRWIDSPHDKQRIFNLQYHCHNLAIRGAQRTRRTRPGGGGGGFTLGGTAVPGGGGGATVTVFAPNGSRVDLNAAIAARARTLWSELLTAAGNQALQGELRDGAAPMEVLLEIANSLLDTFVREHARHRLGTNANNAGPNAGPNANPNNNNPNI